MLLLSRMSKPRRPKSAQSTSDPFEKSKPERALTPVTPSLFGGDDLTLDAEDEAALAAAATHSPTPTPAVEDEIYSSPKEGSFHEPDQPSEDSAMDEDTEALDELPASRTEEFESEASPSRPRRPRREEAALPSAQQTQNPKLDRIGKIAAMILVPLIFVGVFYTILNKRPVSTEISAKAKPNLPIDGKLVKISEASTGWRERTEDDRVSPESQLLSKGTVYPSKLPELHLKLSSASPNAFLRVLFINSDGKIAGDPKVIKVVNGKIQPSGSGGDKVISDQECTVAASTGLQTTRHLFDYLRGNQNRWSVEISESADYQAKSDDWKLLDSFAIADTKL